MPLEAVANPKPTSPVIDTEAWLKQHQAEMLTCERMPGRPRITKEACSRRHNLAVSIATRSGNESLFDGGGPVGIDICLDCPTAISLFGVKVA